MSERVYLVYHDSDTGLAKHVIAKNRKDAMTKVDFNFTHVAWRPWVKFIDGRFINSDTGKEMEIQ